MTLILILFYSFDSVIIEGNAHVAILSNTSYELAHVDAGLLEGDRSGVLHIGQQQTFNFSDVNTYIPVNIMAYRLDAFHCCLFLLVAKIVVVTHDTVSLS